MERSKHVRDRATGTNGLRGGDKRGDDNLYRIRLPLRCEGVGHRQRRQKELMAPIGMTGGDRSIVYMNHSDKPTEPVVREAVRRVLDVLLKLTTRTCGPCVP